MQYVDVWIHVNGLLINTSFKQGWSGSVVKTGTMCAKNIMVTSSTPPLADCTQFHCKALWMKVYAKWHDMTWHVM